jgi:hypothetical protein
MGTTTRFTNGVTNAEKDATLGFMGQPDPTKFHSYFNDFDTYAAGDWTITKTEAGAGSATQALTAGPGGLLLLTNDAADNDAQFFQLTVASFALVASKRAFFKARFKVSDATQSDLQIGLIVTDTTPLDATDGIYFMKDDGDANLDVYVRKDATTGSNSATAVATLVNDTYVTVGFFYDGRGKVHYFVDDVKVEQLDASSSYLPDANLAVSFGIQNGEAVAKTMTLDYIFAAVER